MKVIRNKHFSVHNLRFSGLQLALASSGLMLLLVGLFMVPNFIPDSTHADDDFPPPISDPSISIAPAGGINLVMTPNVGSGGSFGTAIANVTVNTSNTTGYTFTMNTETTNTDLLNNKIDYTQSGASDYKITNLSSSTTTSNFPLNKWGYNVHKSGTYIKGAANTFIPVPNSSSSDADRQIEITSTNGSNTYSFAYGVKANVNMPAGDYSTTIVFSATANPLPTMQDFDYTACQALSTGDTVTMYDERDNEEYLIGKLADDNCWMLDNMRLDLTDSTILNSLTTNNTNVDSASLTSLKSGNRSADNRYANSGFEIWDSSHTTSQYNQAKANVDYKDTVASATYGAGSGKIGVYYNYCAASAGNYCYDSNAGVDDTSTLQDAQYDICPKGWRMPTGGSSGEYQGLYDAYSSDIANFRTALSTPLSGYFGSGSAYSQGSVGRFWSSTWSRTSYMNNLATTASNIIPSHDSGRSAGYSVRCMVDKPVIKNGMYMQDVTQEQISNTPTDVTYTLKDKRDETEYTVAKLQDGNLWMLDNLRLDLTDSTVLNSLTTDNTNVDSASLTSLKSGNRAAGDRYATTGFATWNSSNISNQYNQAKANAGYKNTTTTSYGAGSGKIGVYYNYCAASAGNYCYNENAGVDDISTLQDAEYDICPKNWRMPTSTSTGEYQALLTAYNNNQTATDSGSLQHNLSTPLSGTFYSGSASNRGSYGRFWSSTWDNAYGMRNLYVDASYVHPSSNNSRDNGFSVRCLVPGA